MAENQIYGIDLGTTYSCIAYVDEHGKPVVVPNADNDMTTPSVVYFESPGNIVVGETAKEVAETYPKQVISTVKRVMGDTHWEFEYEGVLIRRKKFLHIFSEKWLLMPRRIPGIKSKKL
jgi:molecular chaperone DnaK